MNLRLIFKIEDIKANPKLSSYAPRGKPLWVKFGFNYNTEIGKCQINVKKGQGHL